VRRLRVIDLPAHRRGGAARVLRNSLRLVRGVPPLVDRFAGFAAAVEAFVAGRQYDVAVIEHFWCAPYGEAIAPYARRTVLDLHNVESVLHARCAASAAGPAAYAHRVFARACRALEREWMPRYDVVLAVSEADAAYIRALAPAVQVYPNALPWVATPPREEEDVIVFSGNFEYHPNVAAVRWFRLAVWPRLAARFPTLRWRLAGKNPHGVARFTRGDPRIEMAGPVEDAIAVLARAKVAVAPLLAGSGTRVKILEAWAAGVPVVSTRVGAEGLAARDGEHLLLADTPEDFAESVARLLVSPDLRRAMGGRGRALFEQAFTWEAAWAGLRL